MQPAAHPFFAPSTIHLRPDFVDVSDSTNLEHRMRAVAGGYANGLHADQPLQQGLLGGDVVPIDDQSK